MGILLYQKFNGEKSAEKGNWQASSMDQIVEKRFFVANHNLSACFTFFSESTIDETEIKEEIDSAIKEKSTNFLLSEQSYKKLLESFQQEMNNRNIQKAIFSRVERVNGSFDAYDVYESLCQKYKGKAFIYLIASHDFGVWVGATPEVLIQGKENDFATVALAGTKADRSTQWTSKEIEEQNMVSQFIRSSLLNLRATNLEESPVETVFSGSVYHLSSRFQFATTEVLRFIRQLHPTPAVCGLPRDSAQKLIDEKEPHQRKFYTGVLGWLNQQNVQTFVNLRCMEVYKGSADLYVGGGITKDSVIENEWEETLIKADTLKTVMHLDSL
jgi:isochorismate synthase